MNSNTCFYYRCLCNYRCRLSFPILRLKGKSAVRNFVVLIAETNLTGSITNFLFGSSVDVVTYLGKRKLLCYGIRYRGVL